MSFIDRIRELQAKDPPRKWRRRPEVLLSANTVKPMHGVVPRVILGKEWWDETRRRAYESTDFHCIACGVHKLQAAEHQWLEGHEVYRTDYVRGRLYYLETVPLCHYCHNYIHCGRLQALAEKGEIPAAKFRAVMRHGDKVVYEADIRPDRQPRGKVAPWGAWRLVLMGKEYPPLYKNFTEWKKHFGYMRD